MESFKVFNPHNLNVSFNVAPSHDFAKFEGMAKHKVRRIIRGAVIPICVRAKHSVDLVKETGLTVAELQANGELNSMLKMGFLILQETTLDVTVSEVEEGPIKIEVKGEVPPEFLAEETTVVRLDEEGDVKEILITEPVTVPENFTMDLGVVEEKEVEPEVPVIPEVKEAPAIVIPEMFQEKEKEPVKKKRGRKKSTKKA